ncbi:PhzF family phenazine biosynthesis protein [Fusibacter tunisiensis]|uniref:PhzF family phenazine biosynthesis protein n=1 Tax=Fusibacter tunisiensis TaxID=1008308 RepID=A0ABS2MR14_9FIRM|nr:PhzF family phenazine biosynthesis protein [Fusibacter tunisiensis]MBM7561847.1 PhzF family phenazine biosynthesis protein [Fusibacter tunisiensis]
MNAYIVNSFTHQETGGNPAGVILLEAVYPPEEKMQEIASFLNLSETAFIVSGKGAYDFEIRFFTPTDEVPLCGHATLASIHMLSRLGKTHKKSLNIGTKAGMIKIEIKGDGTLFMKQPTPHFRLINLVERQKVEACFSIKINEEAHYPIEIWNTGLDDLILKVKSEKDLNALSVSFEALSQVSKQLNVVGAHVFTIENNTLYARNFAPLYGINEESATGTSNGALAAYLHHHIYPNQDLFEALVLQGVAMNHTSAIQIKSKKTQTEKSIWVGGHCHWVKTVTI